MRGLVLGGVAFGVVYFLERQFEKFASDIARYDRLRAMSGDPPFLREGLNQAIGIITSFGAARSEKAIGMLQGLQDDVVRYARIKSM
ncbi:hypothetical protein WPS_17890 [Vulcanimicrobium alpinum]|uniref:Uncharacterized protein n=1 Tax=Vulcanimicrobium alpinum TaxID=3016050 RepID=A0AAN1XW46_UNVUL|nr:hypothetical protein [Vulcanimicrobium alpinum]BDE06513.1 hypothetical protein WPS_17890 [Vulcanimicrobium alpinum]